MEFQKNHNRKVNIVYAGQISKQKGVDILIKVWNKFQNKNLVLNLIEKVVDEDLVENQKKVLFIMVKKAT